MAYYGDLVESGLVDGSVAQNWTAKNVYLAGPLAITNNFIFNAAAATAPSDAVTQGQADSIAATQTGASGSNGAPGANTGAYSGALTTSATSVTAVGGRWLAVGLNVTLSLTVQVVIPVPSSPAARLLHTVTVPSPNRWQVDTTVPVHGTAFGIANSSAWMSGALSSATASSFTFSINTQNRSDPIVPQTVTVVLEAMFTIAP
jgi:hypothetical protein